MKPFCTWAMVRSRSLRPREWK